MNLKLLHHTFFEGVKNQHSIKSIKEKKNISNNGIRFQQQNSILIIKLTNGSTPVLQLITINKRV